MIKKFPVFYGAESLFFSSKNRPLALKNQIYIYIYIYIPATLVLRFLLWCSTRFGPWPPLAVVSSSQLSESIIPKPEQHCGAHLAQIRSGWGGPASSYTAADEALDFTDFSPQ